MVLDRDSRKWLLQLHPEVSGPDVVCVSTNTLGTSARVRITGWCFPQVLSWRAQPYELMWETVKRLCRSSAAKEEEEEG